MLTRDVLYAGPASEATQLQIDTTQGCGAPDVWWMPMEPSASDALEREHLSPTYTYIADEGQRGVFKDLRLQTSLAGRAQNTRLTVDDDTMSAIERCAATYKTPSYMAEHPRHRRLGARIERCYDEGDVDVCLVACRISDDAACIRAGDAFAKGLGVKQDVVHAEALLNQGCGVRRDGPCAQLETLRQTSKKSMAPDGLNVLVMGAPRLGLAGGFLTHARSITGPRRCAQPLWRWTLPTRSTILRPQ